MADRYQPGGYTGTGKRYEPAGVVHRGCGILPGEFFGLTGVVYFENDDEGKPQVVDHWLTRESFMRAVDEDD